MSELPVCAMSRSAAVGRCGRAGMLPRRTRRRASCDGNAAASHPTLGPLRWGYFFLGAAFLPAAAFLRLGLGSLKALGQMSASMHSPHKGLRASHTSRP